MAASLWKWIPDHVPADNADCYVRLPDGGPPIRATYLNLPDGHGWQPTGELDTIPSWYARNWRLVSP